MNIWQKVMGYLPAAVAAIVVFFTLAYQWHFHDTPKELWGLTGTVIGFLINQAFGVATESAKK